jgi:epoxyqueuosine reductase
MDWLARSLAKREDPRRVVEGARTVIVTALHHDARSVTGAEGDRERAVIASYARGDDYHRVLDRRLKAAKADLMRLWPGRYRYHADTGPVLERDWSEQAGVGWIGKNACAIDSARGSFFLLGVIVTTLEVEPDEPAVEHCGTCRACIDACPTSAIVAPREIDSRLCISYLTIEHRGEIPEDLEPRHGNLVFGCDVCQDVCPFNQVDRRGDAALAPREANASPTLADLARLDCASFRARFPRSAVRRAGFEGFLRNVVVGLGNARTAGARSALDELAARDDVRASGVLTRTVERARRRCAEDSP